MTSSVGRAIRAALAHPLATAFAAWILERLNLEMTTATITAIRITPMAPVPTIWQAANGVLYDAGRDGPVVLEPASKIQGNQAGAHPASLSQPV